MPIRVLMFYAKQFKNLLDKVKELDPDAEVVPSLLRIDFNLPIVGKCRLEYVHRGFDDEYDALGTMKLYYGDNMTEFDSLRYTIDGLEGLDRAIKRNMEPSPVNESVEETEDFTTMSADDLSGDVVSYLYDNYKDAAFIGEKSLPDGSIVLRFEWNGVDKDAVAKDLKDRYGDRIGFGSGHLQYAPEIKFDAIKVLPANDAVAVTESIDIDDELGDYYSDLRAEEAEQDAEAENYQEMTEEGVQSILNKLGLTVVNKWYDGNRSRPVFDCQKGNGETICVWTEPPYEAKVWFKDREPGNNRFTEDIITLDSLESELNDLLDEMHEEELNAAAEKISAPDYHAEGAYEDLTDIGGDFEAVEFYKDIKAICDIAGKPALAEAVIKLHKAYHPVLEAVEKAHKVPRDIAVAFNDYIADTLYKRPETHDMLKEREFEPNWEWLDDNAGAVIKVWNETHDPSEIKRLLDNLDEDAACWFEGI